MVIHMANTTDLYGPNRPGPEPLFTERIELRLRPDQVAGVERIAKAFRMSRSELIRLALDQFVTVTEEGPLLGRLETLEVAP